MNKYWKKLFFIAIYYFIVLLALNKIESNLINLIAIIVILILGSEFIKNKIDKE